MSPLRYCQLLVVTLSIALLVRTLTDLDTEKVWALLRPELSHLTEPGTWWEAMVLAGLSTNLNTGANLALCSVRSAYCSYL